MAAIWLDAWSDVVRLCELTGVDSIGEFVDRFSMYLSLLNWGQDLGDALWNVGREDPDFLRVRIAVCEEALRRFADEDELEVENGGRAVAESCFDVGEADKGRGAVRAVARGGSSMGVGLDRVGRPSLLDEQPPEGLRPGRGIPATRMLDARRQGPGGHCRSARAAVSRDQAWGGG